MSVSWSGQFDGAEVAPECFLAVAVPAIARAPSCLGVIEVEIHLIVEYETVQ